MEVIAAIPFLKYYTRIKERTLKIVRLIPENQLHYSLQEGTFSLGDLARHIILIERDLYLPVLKGLTSSYQGCERELAPTLDDILALYENTMMQMHQLISPQSEAYFQERCITPAGVALRKGNWLRALIEHEIHHRGQIYQLLRQLGIEVPQIFQLSSEDVIRLSISKP